MQALGRMAMAAGPCGSNIVGGNNGVSGQPRKIHADANFPMARKVQNMGLMHFSSKSRPLKIARCSRNLVDAMSQSGGTNDSKVP